MKNLSHFAQKMNELNFKIKIIDNFLNEQDYNDLCNLKLIIT